MGLAFKRTHEMPNPLLDGSSPTFKVEYLTKKAKNKGLTLTFWGGMIPRRIYRQGKWTSDEGAV